MCIATSFAIRSSFFNAALTGTFKEAGGGKAIVPEDDLGTFERFLQHVYTQIFNTAPKWLSSSPSLYQPVW